MQEFNLNDTWNNVLDNLKDKIPQSTYEPWILPLVPQSCDENGFNLLCGHTLAIQIIKKNYYDILKNAISQELNNNDIKVNLIYSEELSSKLKKKSSKNKSSNLSPSNNNDFETQDKKSKYDHLKQMQSPSNLNLKYNFDNFVVGDNSKLAFAASKAVAENPGKKYNPLFLYGGVGLGKTHLMQAIGHYILHKHQTLKVKYIKTEEFINDYINSVFKSNDKQDKMNLFRKKYRNVDVLLIDDIQFIEGKERTEIEIFNTFESLHNAGKQIVLTSDRPPNAIPNLSDRLRSRFEWGLMADIQVPDLETRAAIICRLCQTTDVKFPNDVIFFLSEVYNKNIRELEGAFNKINAYAELQEINVLNIEIVKKIINYNHITEKKTNKDIMNIVADYFNVSVKDILSPLRSQQISLARQISIYFIRDINEESFNDIAKIFNKKHTTIMYSYEKIKEELKKNSKLLDQVEFIRNKII